MTTGCRDCSICTMPAAARAGRAMPMMVWTIMTLGLMRMFTRRCPQCRHRLARHSRRADGSFQD